jgi:hypothetical protein
MGLFYACGFFLKVKGGTPNGKAQALQVLGIPKLWAVLDSASITHRPCCRLRRVCPQNAKQLNAHPI